MFKQPFATVKTREYNSYEDRLWLNLYHLCSWALRLTDTKFCDNSML